MGNCLWWMSLSGKPTTMEVDTGASVLLMAKNTFNSLFLPLPLEPLNVKLVMYLQDELHM